MRAIRTGLKYSSRSCTSFLTALVFVLTLCLCGTVAMAQVPASGQIVVNQSTKYGSFSSGGSQSGTVPAGDTMAVTTFGDVIATNTYGNQTVLFSPSGGTPTVLGTTSNPNGVAVDAQNNLFMGFSYNSALIKVPFVNGAYAAIGAPVSGGNPYPSGTPNCTGNDTVECVMSNVNVGADVLSMVFDAKGDLFFATGRTEYVIYECTAACLYSGTPAPTVIYTEPTSSTPSTTGQLNIGGLALDSSNNLFFTDSAVSSTTSQESFSSNLKELPYTAGTGYATSPTTIYTYTPAAAAQYGAEIDGVAVAPNGTVYALIQAAQGSQAGSPAQGIFAFPKESGAYNSGTMYLVSTQAGKSMTSDALGNLYIADDGGNIYQIAVDSVTAPATPAGTPSSATNITTLLNDGGCTTTPPTVTFTPSGTSAADFTLATSGTCTATATGGASYTTTLTFSPTAVGLATATIMSTDSVGSSGTLTASGNATGTVAEPTFSPAAGSYTATQQVTISDATAGASIYYTTDGTTPGAGTGTSTLYTAPVTVSSSETINAIAVEAGDTSSAVASATYAINLPGAALTPTFSPAGGAYNTPQDVTISDGTTGATIYYTTNGSTPTTSSNVYVGPVPVAATETLKAIAVASGSSNSAVASAVYTITQAPSAFQNIVLTQSTQIGSLPSSGGAQSGSEPAGDSMAVNAFGALIASDTYGNETLLYTPGTMTPTVLGTTSNPNGVAVDAENNLFQAFSYNSSVIKVPYVNGAYAAIGAPGTNGPYPNGTPNCTGNDTTECVMNHLNVNSDVESMIFDANGDMFYATGRSTFAIYECTAACLYSGSPAPTVIYTEPTSGSPATTGQLWIGGLALDAAGDLFFTDSAISSTTSEESFSSNLKELVYTAGTGYAATPTVIYSYTPAAAAQYGAEIDGVAVAANGTVYALIQGAQGSQSGSPAQGILAFPKVSGAYSSTTMYLVSTQSGKLMTSDGLGNLYIADNGGNLYQIAVDNLTAPTAPQANPETVTNITTYLNDGGCTATPPTVTFAASGTSASAFSAVTTGSCTATPTGGASFATTLTFDPTAVGTNTATLTATDSLNNTGTATLTGVGTPAPPAPEPTFSVAAGTYTTVQTVALSDTVTTASIYYTLDGSTPTNKSNLYSAPLTVSASETINAIATATGYQSSPVATAAYVINLPVAPTPTFSVAAGTYTTPQTVSISDSVSGLAIYYTTDGSTPTAGTGTSKLYSAPLTLLATETIKAIAAPTSTTPNYTDSTVATALYTINLPTVATPTFSVTPGTFTTVQTVSISDSTSGATIYYTTNGTTPTTSSTVYSGPLTLGVTTTIEAIAIDSPNYNNSAVATGVFTINLPAPGYTLTSSSPTVAVSGGKGTVTITLTANAAFNGNASFSCSGFLPIGATCAFSPATVSAVALGTGTTQLTVTVPQTTAQLHRGTSSLIPGTMLAAMLGLLGLSRKRRRLQVLLLIVFSAIGVNVLSGCATTPASTASSGQMIVSSVGCSTPVNSPSGTQCSATGTATLNLVLSTQ